MGFSISWLAIRGTSAHDACENLGLIRSGEFDEFFDYRISGSALPTGWYLIVFKGTNHKLIRKDNVEKLSGSHDLIVCDIEEHVMYCSAAYWRNGSRVWNVEHDAQKGMYHLEAEGQLPPKFENIWRDCLAEQDAEGGEDAEVDFVFEIPTKLAKEFTGFKHDEALAEANQLTCENLQSGRKSRGWLSWFKR